MRNAGSTTPAHRADPISPRYAGTAHSPRASHSPPRLFV